MSYLRYLLGGYALHAPARRIVFGRRDPLALEVLDPLPNSVKIIGSTHPSSPQLYESLTRLAAERHRTDRPRAGGVTVQKDVDVSLEGALEERRPEDESACRAIALFGGLKFLARAELHYRLAC